MKHPVTTSPEHTTTTHGTSVANVDLRTAAPDALARRSEVSPRPLWNNVGQFLGDLIGGASIFGILFVFLFIGWAYQ